MFKISLFENRFSRVPQSIEIDLHNLKRGLLKPSKSYPVKEKNSLPLWSPTIFNGNRCGANAIQVSCLVYDLDDGTSIEERAKFQKYNYLFHTSFSHTEEKHKYRIILPLAEPIPAQDWRRASIAAKNLWANTIGVGSPDSSAITDVARMYYRYAIPDYNGASIIQHTDHNEGEYLSLDYSEIVFEDPKKNRYKRWELRTEGSKMGMEALFHNASFRLGIAEKIGASIEGNTARSIRCPNCGEYDVYYSIDPSYPYTVLYPHCNRVNKCGWWGRLEDLL